MVSLILPDKIELSYRPNANDPELVDYACREWFAEGTIDEATFERTLGMVDTVLSSAFSDGSAAKVGGVFAERMLQLDVTAIPKKRAADMIVGEFLAHSTFGSIKLGDFFASVLVGGMQIDVDAVGSALPPLDAVDDRPL